MPSKVWAPLTYSTGEVGRERQVFNHYQEKGRCLAIIWGELGSESRHNRLRAGLSLTDHAGLVHLTVFNHIFWVDLILFIDDKDGGIQPGVHTTVIHWRWA